MCAVALLVLDAIAEAAVASGVHDRVRQDAEPFDGDVDAVAGHDLADSGWGPGEDDVAGQQGNGLGQVLDEGRDVEDEVGGGPVLLLVSVDPGADVQVIDVEFGFDPRAQRAGGVEALRPRPLLVGLLDVARSHRFRGKAEDVVEGVHGLHTLGHTADDDGEFGLIGDVFADGGQADGVAGADDRSVGFEEGQG